MTATSIPPFHVLGLSKAKGNGNLFVSNKGQAVTSGIFHIDMNVHFDPAVDSYPAGTLSIQTDLGDGGKGIFKASTIEFLNSYNKHDPTIYLTGQCQPDEGTATADICRYWVMVVNNTKNNHRSPDIVGFCIQDGNGKRIAYGSGF
ncbi:MAG: hypothetical protein ABIQ31_02215 [Ferruginibacter sp.]